MGVPLNIDWQQILLHLFNFLILAGGLYLLLYKPVKAFMEKRRNYYADMDSKANAERAAAQKEKMQYEESLKAAEAEIAEMKEKAMESAKESANEYIEDAKNRRQKILLKAQAEAQAEKEKIFAKANSEIEAMVSAAIDKMLVSENTDPLDEFLDRAEKEN